MGLFDWMGSDPSKAADKYLKQIPGMAKENYNPYIDAGLGQLPGLQEQFAALMNDPGAKLNQMGQGFQQSPGFDFALKQALQGAGNAAAAGGMAGSPQHEYQNMDIATGLANQDYNNWMKNAMGLYGTGLAGSEGMYNTGFNASNMLAQMLAGNLNDRASNAAGGAQWKNNMNLGMTGLGLTGALNGYNGFNQPSGGGGGAGGGSGGMGGMEKYLPMLMMMMG